MKFGDIALDAAQGAILAHSVALPDGRLRKGTALEAGDIARLRAAGHESVTAAVLEPGDVAEDAAAARLARALVPDPEEAGLTLGRAATGRVNLHAEGPGLVEIDPATIAAVNAVDPMITVATVRPYARTAARGMVATVKVIAYAVPEAALDAACAAAPASGALRLRAPVLRRAALIQTSVDGSETGGKGDRVTRERLDRLGVALDAPCVVPHATRPLSEALAASDAELLLILTGSATSDARDTAPEAVRRAGGTVAHFGMPVDPGNLLFFGAMGDGRPVIGLPGCARSPALNGADWVMERLICGVTVTPADIAAMGVGGLLKEIPQRGRLREA
ncbi:molybdopterin-binding protein [Citreimonas salinaria]|uniref:Molybdenum cofactor cytidylyltransferase n=1 Tax=Citreimonas salinaria TaxID=321339 RepID=A0A1H3IKF5_9RHOB|nr:molybdopterin-binding protein [Citreimonas salinaria]SDY28067.1 molybdenum cofactor cytidylyltransferase [Citreimonas salinaria]